MPRVILAQAERRSDHFETSRDATQTRVCVMGLLDKADSWAAADRKLLGPTT
jgi:hypothetical protein